MTQQTTRVSNIDDEQCPMDEQNAIKEALTAARRLRANKISLRCDGEMNYNDGSSILAILVTNPFQHEIDNY